MTDDWVTMASFFTPPEPQPDFEAAVACTVDRFTCAAKEAGLDPKAHVRVRREDIEVFVDISPTLDAAFEPTPILWKAQ